MNVNVAIKTDSLLASLDKENDGTKAEMHSKNSFRVNLLQKLFFVDGARVK